ncbi:MAG: hypothetical protein Q9170_006839 [Blastenia crenularia]
MAKHTAIARTKRIQREKDSAQTRVEQGRVVKSKKKTSNGGSQSGVPRHGKKRRATMERLSQSFDDLNYLSDNNPQFPSTPGSSRGQVSHSSRPKTFCLSQILNPKRSFWDTLKGISYDQPSSTEATLSDEGLTNLMERMNRQISYQIDIHKFEPFTFLSRPSHGYDPRELDPLDEAEIEDLNWAIWPTLQHLTELTKSRPRIPSRKECYVAQLQSIHKQVQSAWEEYLLPGVPPPLFLLEAWNGGIKDWRTSYFTNGEERFPASVIANKIDLWSEDFPASAPPAQDLSFQVTDISTSDEDYMLHETETVDPRHDFGEHNASLTLTSSSASHRPVTSALFEDYPHHDFTPINPRLTATSSRVSHRPALYDSTRDTASFFTTTDIQSGPTLTITTSPIRLPSLPIFPTTIGVSPLLVTIGRRSTPNFQDGHDTPLSNGIDGNSWFRGLSSDSDKENDKAEAERIVREEEDRQRDTGGVFDGVEGGWVGGERIGMMGEVGDGLGS